MAVALVDTNVLVYAHDEGAGAKQSRAIELLSRIGPPGDGRLSVQTLSEFFAATTRTRSPLLSVAEAKVQVERLARSWPLLDLTPAIVLEALRGVEERRLSFWDAQLWATARLNQVGVILSEDFADGSVVDGVRFVNPFTPQFAIDAWAPAR